jgi:hypothetical protein
MKCSFDLLTWKYKPKSGQRNLSRVEGEVGRPTWKTLDSRCTLSVEKAYGPSDLLRGTMKPAFALLFPLIALLVSPRISLPQERTCESSLPVFVTDNDGHLLTTLSSTDFKLENHGAPMSVLSWRPDGRRHRVVILLDVSGSMKGLPGSDLWNVVMGFVQHVVAIDSDNAEFALLLFSDRVLETVEFSEGKVALRHKLEDISRNSKFPIVGTGKDTRIYDALKDGVQLLENPTSAYSLLVITDGLDEGSKSKPNAILQLLSGATVRVFSIMVDPLPSVSAAQNEFVVFVQKSGGEVFGPVNAEKAGIGGSSKSVETRKVMTERMVQFYRGMLENDVLTIQISSGNQTPQALGLSLTDSARRQWKKTRLYVPHQIGPCPSLVTTGKAPGS